MVAAWRFCTVTLSRSKYINCMTISSQAPLSCRLSRFRLNLQPLQFLTFIALHLDQLKALQLSLMNSLISSQRFYQPAAARFFCGDLNCPSSDDNHVDNGLSLLLISLGGEQMVCWQQSLTIPTHGSAALDVLAFNASDIFTDVSVIVAGLTSDHSLLMAYYSIGWWVMCATSTFYRFIKKIEMQLFKAALHNSTIFTSPESTVDSFT